MKLSGLAKITFTFFNIFLAQIVMKVFAKSVVGSNPIASLQTRSATIPLSPSTIEFFESPDGVRFLEQLVNVLQFVMTQVGSCGIRLVSLILQMSSLDYFVASSYETLRERGIKMEEAIIEFGEEER